MKMTEELRDLLVEAGLAVVSWVEGLWEEERLNVPFEVLDAAQAVLDSKEYNDE